MAVFSFHPEATEEFFAAIESPEERGPEYWEFRLARFGITQIRHDASNESRNWCVFGEPLESQSDASIEIRDFSCYPTGLCAWRFRGTGIALA